MTMIESLLLDVPALFALIDHELELVEPDPRYIDEVLAASHHPLTRELMPHQARTTRHSVEQFLAHHPRGHTLGNPSRNLPAGYTFWMRLRTDVPPLMPHRPPPSVRIAGSISLRIGPTANLDLFLGHIGYHVLPPARGHHFSERATRLLLPLARAHGHDSLWITCNPDNLASRKTIERLGAVWIDQILVPRDNALYTQGDREKCRYRLDL